jgi:GTPase SAR1 family protein
MKCLLIETKDRRKFFTHEKNFINLIEFSKTFNAKVSVVKLEEGPVLELEQLAPAICDPAYKKPKVQYELVEKKLANIGRTRTAILRAARQIKKYILEKFQTREVVSLKELKRKFKRHKLSDAALCNHVRRVKQELSREGYTFVKVGAGQYKVQ